jgi:hypothetical protein
MVLRFGFPEIHPRETRDHQLHGGTGDGRIAAAAGDNFPSNDGFAMNNFAAYMEFDSTSVRRTNEWHNTTGYEIAGWSLVKGETFGYMIGGNHAAFLLGSDGVLISKNEYTVFVHGVGTEKNKVSRIRKLRDGRMIVVGQSYEEHSWTLNQRLNYDAWWTTLSAGGTPDARNVTGMSGRDDRFYDAAQLADGRIAFVGTKGTALASGIWALVTDSSGKTIQWQSLYILPGDDDGSDRNYLFPMALQPTADSGFIVVGVEVGGNRNNNAFAFKFIHKSKPVAIRSVLSSKSVPPVRKRRFDLRGRTVDPKASNIRSSPIRKMKAPK